MPRRSFSRVEVIGFIANEPTLRYTQEGRAVINLRILENERFKQGEEWVQRTHGHNTEFWGDYAEIVAKHARKGGYARVVGTLRYRDIEGQQYAKEARIVGDEFDALDRAPNDETASDAADSQAPNF